MKICPKCNTGNNNNAIQCKDCGHSLTKVNIEDYRNYVQEIEKENTRKHKKKMLIHNISLSIFGILYIYFYIRIILKVNFFETTFIAVLIPVVAYLNIHHPKVMFILGHFLAIDNIDDVELSDWYIFWSKISGLIFAIIGFVFMAIFAFNV